MRFIGMKLVFRSRTTKKALPPVAKSFHEKFSSRNVASTLANQSPHSDNAI
jgi:hypothetical protein